jgi:hypothetical protein
MATIKTSGDLLASISADLSDNNAGLISAEDVRHNMEDAVRSINQIVASGDTDGEWPFTQDVRVAHDPTAGTGGIVYAESGIIFPRSSVDQTGRQQEPFLGIVNLSHNALANLTGLAQKEQIRVLNLHPRPLEMISPSLELLSSKKTSLEWTALTALLKRG